MKVDPDGDILMKSESEDAANSRSTSSTLQPPNGLNVRHDLKQEDVKQEKSDDNIVIKTEPKDETKVNESEDKENEDGES